MNAEVWLNSHFLGRHPYGYTSFDFDLTPYLDVGAENTVRADGLQSQELTIAVI
jgi:beta-galactosidase